MQAHVGDHLIVQGMHVGEHVRDGEILEIRGSNGTPPYLVRWSDSGHEALVYPGPDCMVQTPGSAGAAGDAS